MLSFFKVNASYQVFSLAILLIILKMLTFGQAPLLIPELQWMLVGEKMGDGFTMYRDIWDNLSPLSSIVYWLIDLSFGRSQIAYQIIAGGVVIFQGIYFNQIIHRRQLLNENNYVAGAIYMLFMSVSFDCQTLSPMLMATTFLLLAFGGVIKQLGREGATDDVFEIGFYLSLATLTDFSTIVFLAWLLISLLIYTGVNFRHITLVLFGFLFPIALTFLIFFFRGTSDDFFWNLLQSVVESKTYSLDGIFGLFICLATPLLLALLGFFKTTAFGRFSNFQNRCQQIMVWWLIIGLLSFLFVPFISPMQFIWATPPLAFFATNFFIIWRKRKWLSEILFIVFFGLVLFVNFSGIHASFPHQFAALRVKNGLLPNEIKNKKILVVGKSEGEYKDNLPTTCYFNWTLAKYDLQQGDSYQSIISIFDNFANDPPQYIIDKEGVMKNIFERLPELRRRYKTTAWKNIYEKV